MAKRQQESLLLRRISTSLGLVIIAVFLIPVVSLMIYKYQQNSIDLSLAPVVLGNSSDYQNPFPVADSYQNPFGGSGGSTSYINPFQ